MRVRFCPFLGLDIDPDTRMNFPSERNQCYRAKPPSGVGLTHQSTHCLNSNHLRCPMFATKAPGPLPSVLSDSPPTYRGRNVLVTGMLVIMLTALFIFIWWQQALPAMPAPAPTEYQPATQMPAVIPTETALPPSPAPTDTAPPPAETPPPAASVEPSPTLSPTDTPHPSATAAACQGAPAGWVTYTVQPGDTLFNISLSFGTTVEKLQQANCLNTTLIHTGEKLFVPNVPTRTPQPASATPEPPTATEQPTTAPSPTPEVTKIFVTDTVASSTPTEEPTSNSTP